MNEAPKYMKLDAWGRTYDTCIEIDSYLFGGGLYLQLCAMEDGFPEPYADITVNLEGYPTEGSRAFVDTNNFEQAVRLIEQYKLGVPTGRLGISGYCTYPEYLFDMNEIRKYCFNPMEAERVLTNGQEEKSAR